MPLGSTYMYLCENFFGKYTKEVNYLLTEYENMFKWTKYYWFALQNGGTVLHATNQCTSTCFMPPINAQVHASCHQSMDKGSYVTTALPIHFYISAVKLSHYF